MAILVQADLKTIKKLEIVQGSGNIFLEVPDIGKLLIYGVTTSLITLISTFWANAIYADSVGDDFYFVLNIEIGTVESTTSGYKQVRFANRGEVVYNPPSSPSAPDTASREVAKPVGDVIDHDKYVATQTTPTN